MFWKLRRSQRKSEEENLREAETIRKHEGRNTEDDKERKSKDRWAVGAFFVGVGVVYFVLEVMEVSLRRSWSIRSQGSCGSFFNRSSGLVKGVWGKESKRR